MRKFTISASVCLACCLGLLIAGCGGNGDDPVLTPVGATSVATNKVSVTQNYVIPGPAIAVGSLRAATYWREFALRINGIDYAPTSYTVDSSGSVPMVTLIFTLTIPKSALGSAWNDTTKTLTGAQLIEGGQPILTITSMTANDKATTADGTPSPTTLTISLFPDPATGGLGVQVTGGTAQIVSLIPTASDTLYLEAIYYTKNGQLATLTTSVTDVPAPLATFTLYFNTLIINPTTSWNCTVTNTDSNSSFQLSSGVDDALFQVTSTGFDNRTIVTISVLGSASKRLKTNTSYKVTLNNTSIRRADKPSVAFPGMTRTFKTGLSQ